MTAGPDDPVPVVIHAADCPRGGCEGECDLANIDDMGAIIRELRRAADPWMVQA